HEKDLVSYFPSNNQKKFITKRIQIFQMIENEEMKQLKEKLLEKDNEAKENKFNQIKEQLNQKTKEMKENKSEEIKQIEELCDFMEMKEILFDSDCCDWTQHTSIFDKMI
ncbi:MAG: hypothetical protein J6C16_03010, partial [Clostridia bacterium]|nr:hypothetical protein [Clostridia bacterium]